MFQDIVTLTKATLINALEDTTLKLDVKALYDTYRTMGSAIHAMHILEVHYLHLPFDSHVLQDSQHGAPFKKWYVFMEQDFEHVRKNLRAFLSNLIDIKYQKSDEEVIYIIEKVAKSKQIFGFFSHYYESGKLSNDGLGIHYTKLLIDEKQFHEEAFISIDTYEKRVALCKEIRMSVEAMIQILKKIKSFLLLHASLDELL